MAAVARCGLPWPVAARRGAAALAFLKSCKGPTVDLLNPFQQDHEVMLILMEEQAPTAG